MMNFKSLAGAALILSMASGSAFAQSNDVKGWTPKPKAPIAGGGDNAPKTITRGESPNPPPGPGANQNPGPAPAFEVVLANDPVGIQQAMMNAGYRAELTTDDQGNPKIIGTASKSTYWILFLDCQASSGCLGLEFYVSYSLDRKPTLEQVDQFNNDFRYIRAFTNKDGQPRMMMDILVRDGGLDKRTFLEYVRLWTVIMPSFEEMIGV
ncbi:YbjN domain-containing protein [Frigidibacter sp. ROC022]|uniref:YbjN domain-containing protein n=1 Tax=Frigidibacter sp. ROC022 TaxID=2971796 RepID=UPI00215ADB4E|nr:YbjN domain-containing protein [Frigidibacter sp. ROC022]MCR8724222.1 YbjN domain-containing protein [Frigidibacter sp. ROC022]